MRKTLVITALLALCAHGATQYVNRAYQIDGTNSYAAAAYSGARSTGNFVTAVGNSSFRQADGNGITTIGQMSSALSGGNEACTFVGEWAGYASSNLYGCVGIGAGAFMGAHNHTNCTVINGHLNVDGDRRRFWITPEKASTVNWDGCPPIYYNAGTLYLNARQIVKRDGVVETTAPLWTSDWNRNETNAIYVAEYGSDEYSGASAYYPKKTLQAAIMALTNDTTTIYLDRGVYGAPDYLDGTIASTAHRISIVGVGRRDEVVIDCGGEHKMSAGSSGYFCEIKNATIRDPRIPSVNAGNNNRAALQLLFLENCRIEGTNAVVRNAQWLFYGCSLDGCDVDFNISTAGETSDPSYGVIFSLAKCRNTTMRFRTLSEYAANLGYALDLENCYIDADRIDRFRISTASTWDGRASWWKGVTLMLGSARKWYWDSSQYDWEALPAGAYSGNVTNSVFGLGNDGLGQHFANFAYRTSATNLTARLDPDTHRPAMSDFDLLPFGYNSAADRAVRDAAAATVIDALVASGTVTQEQSAALTARRAELVARNAVEPMKMPDPAEPVTVETDAQEE